MFSSALLTTLLAAVAVVRAEPVPTSPGPGDVFNEGASCSIAWNADTTSQWTTMYIELMTGPNLDMVHLTTVATVDGSDPTKTTFSYTCPSVTPNAPIYFYQFTSPDSLNVTWTTRFAIADANGNTTPAPNNTQPGGQAIPWGTGTLLDPSAASPPPPPPGSNVTNNAAGATSTSPSSSTSGPSAVVESPLPSSNSFSSSAPVNPSSPGLSVTAQSSSATPNATGAAKANSAVGVAVDFKLLQAVTSLAAVAATFAFVL